MYLAYNHFYHSKKHLYCKPVKGLQGYGLGYRFHFNGKENDNETQTQDYGFRIYNSRLGKFLSIDPMTKQYPMLTPYQFASNRPIDGNDLDGLEWRRKTFIIDGLPVIGYEIDLQVINKLKSPSEPLSEFDIQRIKGSIIKDIENILTNGLGCPVTINPIFVEGDNKDGKYPFTLTLKSKEVGVNKSYRNGETKMSNTQLNNIDVIYAEDNSGQGYLKPLPIYEISRVIAHELGHTAGLEHPWQVIDIRQDDANQNEPNVKSKTVLDNLMNSYDNDDKELRSDTGRKLTDGQKNVVKDTVTKQEPK